MTKTIFGTALLTTILLTSIIAPTQVFAASSNGFDGPYEMQNWSDTGIAGGTTSITPSSGPATTGEFGYNVNLGNPAGGVTFRTATFSTTAEETGTVTFDYEYSGFHAFFNTQIHFETFADTSSGTVNTVLESGSGSTFTKTGSTTINVEQGKDFGFIIGGGNFDSNSQIVGTLKITNFQAPVIEDTAHADILSQLQNVVNLLGGIQADLTSVLDLLLDPTFGLEEIKNEVRTIEETIGESTERVSVTVNLDDLKLKAGEVTVLLDTTGSGTLSTVHVAANLPCDKAGAPQLHVVAGVAGGSLSGVLTEAADNTGFDGPEKTCVFHDTVNAADLGHDITDVIVLNPGTSSDDDDDDDDDGDDDKGKGKSQNLKGVVVTVTGTYN